jgi:hypothetical protein
MASIRFPLGISSNTTCSTALTAGTDHTSELCELSYLYDDAEQIDVLAFAICLRRDCRVSDLDCSYRRSR